MHRYILLFIVTTLGILLLSFTNQKKQKRLLVFSKTAGFRHSSIAQGKMALLTLGEKNNWKVDTTEEASFFCKKKLRHYDAVVFLNTTGDVLNKEQQAAFEKFIQSGHGFVGIHAATDTEYDWPWYCKLAGANFSSHPKQQFATLRVIDSLHPATIPLPKIWHRYDEWYNFKNRNNDVQVLLTIDESTYEGGKEGNYHPMSWYHNYDGGRAFYTALGHTAESYAEPAFLQHITGGIVYAIGD